jgi:hypothetical protein
LINNRRPTEDKEIVTSLFLFVETTKRNITIFPGGFFLTTEIARRAGWFSFAAIKRQMKKRNPLRTLCLDRIKRAGGEY